MSVSVDEVSNTYKYRATMQYVLDSEITDIDVMSIKSIICDYDYDGLNMPLVYVTASLDKKLVDKMIKHQDAGLVIFNIQRCVSNSDMPGLYTDYLNDKFIYFIEEDVNKADEVDYSGMNEDRNDIFKVVQVGLMSLDLVNKNKNPVNGVISGKKASILYYIAGHLPILIEPLTENTDMKSIFLPPQNTVSKLIAYINKLSVLYDTQYRFFMDFGVTYLISSSGKKVPQRSDKINSVLITLRNSFETASKVQGMSLDESGGICKIEADGIDCQVADYQSLNKSFATLNAVTTTADKTSKAVIDPGPNLAKKEQRIRVPNGNSGLLDNMTATLITGETQLLISKTDLDSSVLTINKEYTIKADDVYKTDKYNGKYLLSRKRELYIREDQNFSMSTILLLKKLPS